MHGSPGREPRWSRPRVQISVVVANIRTRPSKTEVEKGSVPTAVEHGSVGPKTRAKVFPKGAGSVSRNTATFFVLPSFPHGLVVSGI